MFGRGRLRKKRFFFGLTVVLAVLALLLAGGCGQKAKKPDTGTNRPEISAEPGESKEKITLYFSDHQAMYLVPEEREVVKGRKPIESVIIEELIKGPEKQDLRKTIPHEAKLISVKVVNGVAYVNFSREFQSKHWGGSTGELMTLFSVTNSLCKLPGIEKVQFLLEGQTQESILGHADTTGPMAPNWDMVQK